MTEGQRMRKLRTRLGYRKPGKFAAMLGVSVSNWCNVESGHPVSLDMCARLKTKIPGMSRDYIWDGEADKLSRDLQSYSAKKRVCSLACH